MMGAGLGFLLFLYVAFALGMFNIGIAMWASIFFTSVAASIVGFGIPFLLEKAGQDPTIGSGPVGTLVSDLSSLTLYSIVSFQLLAFLG